LLSPDVEVFRGGTAEGYPFWPVPLSLAAVISVAMPNCNPDCRDSPIDRPTSDVEYEMLVRKRIVAMFKAAQSVCAEVVVLPAIGCGVFLNEPRVIGTVMGNVLRTEFKNVFKKVLALDHIDFGMAVLTAWQPSEVPRSIYVAVESGAISDLAPGMKAFLKGITAKPELNGTVCTIVSWDKSASKWVVELAGGQKARLAAANLMPECSGAAGLADVAVSLDKSEDPEVVAVLMAPALSIETLPVTAPATAAVVTAPATAPATAPVSEPVALLEQKDQPESGSGGA